MPLHSASGSAVAPAGGCTADSTLVAARRAAPVFRLTHPERRRYLTASRAVKCPHRRPDQRADSADRSATPSWSRELPGGRLGGERPFGELQRVGDQAYCMSVTFFVRAAVAFGP